jgi:hypothetical protein
MPPAPAAGNRGISTRGYPLSVTQASTSGRLIRLRHLTGSEFRAPGSKRRFVVWSADQLSHVVDRQDLAPVTSALGSPTAPALGRQVAPGRNRRRPVASQATWWLCPVVWRLPEYRPYHPRLGYRANSNPLRE